MPIKKPSPERIGAGTNPFRLTSTTSLFVFFAVQNIVCDLEVVDGPLQFGVVRVNVVSLALGTVNDVGHDRHAMAECAVGVCVLVCGVGGVHGCIVAVRGAVVKGVSGCSPGIPPGCRLTEHPQRRRSGCPRQRGRSRRAGPH